MYPGRESNSYSRNGHRILRTSFSLQSQTNQDISEQKEAKQVQNRAPILHTLTCYKNFSESLQYQTLSDTSLIFTSDRETHESLPIEFRTWVAHCSIMKRCFDNALQIWCASLGRKVSKLRFLLLGFLSQL